MERVFIKFVALQASNTAPEPKVLADVPALRRARLGWVKQNYIRADTLTAANAKLAVAQNSIGLVQVSGGGEVASADGIWFLVAVRTILAGPNPKYFGRERGVTYCNVTSDRYTGLNGVVVPGTMRDSLVLLAVPLEQASGLMRMLQTNNSPTKLARALADLRRMIKTMHLLNSFDDKAYRRRILVPTQPPCVGAGLLKLVATHLGRDVASRSA